MTAGSGAQYEPDKLRDGHDAGSPTDVAARFRAAWARDEDPQTADPDLLPTRLTRACAELLHCDGAGLSLYDADFRVPLGASDDAATHAEQLQFTHGEGPCLSAGRDRRVLVVDADQIRETWPAYAADLFESTPFQAVISLPLVTAQDSSGALDLFFHDSSQLHRIGLSDATTITEEMTAALAYAQDADRGGVPYAGSGVSPTWLRTSTAHVRAQVWVATGMAMARFELDAPAAIALLRSFAYAGSQVLDDVAVALVERRLSIEEIAA